MNKQAASAISARVGIVACMIHGGLIDYSRGRTGLLDFYAGTVDLATGKLALDRNDREVELYVKDQEPFCLIRFSDEESDRYEITGEGVAVLTVASIDRIAAKAESMKPLQSAPGTLAQFEEQSLTLVPSGRFITDGQGRKIAEVFQPGDSPLEQCALKRRIIRSFNGFPILATALRNLVEAINFSPLGVRGIKGMEAAKIALGVVGLEDPSPDTKVTEATPTRYAYLDVSTGHLSRKTIEFLESVSGTNNIRLMVASYEHGFWVSVPPESTDYDDAVPADLRVVLDFARTSGCPVARFDSVGECYVTLPYFEDEPQAEAATGGSTSNSL